MFDTSQNIRPFPYPYRSMFTICSDLDETPDATSYFELLKFLNTTEQTPMGTGVGLEIGNSMYFMMPPGQFSYSSANEMEKEQVRTCIKSGHIDCLHSFGDLIKYRREVEGILEELEKMGAGFVCGLIMR